MKKITDKTKIIVFDWDGTIFNSMEYKKNNIIKSIQKFKNIDSNKIIELHNKYTGIPRKSLIECIWNESIGEVLNDITFEAISTLYTQLNIESSKNAVIFEDSLRLLSKIKNKKNINIYVSSSAAKEEIVYSAKKNHIYDFFIEMLGSNGEFSKGAGHFNYISNKEGVDREKITFIGDDHQDYLIGLQNCINTYQICRGNTPVNKNYQIGSMDEIELDS